MESIKTLFKRKNIDRLLTLLVVIYTVFLLCRMLFSCYQTLDFANEYREAANIAMTRTLMKGESPYMPSSINGDIPPVCYLYGPLMSMIAAILGLLSGAERIQLIHYGISFFSILISAALVAHMVQKRCQGYCPMALGFMLTVFCHWRYGYIFGAPDSLGLLIMIWALYALDKCSETPKQQEPYPEFAAFITVLSFFTKQYFLMVAATGAVYLLFVSKKKFLRYSLTGIISSLAAFLILKSQLPLYFTYAIYFIKGPGAGAAMGKTGRAYNTMQVSYLGGMLLMLFIAALAALVRFCYIQLKGTRIHVNIKDINMPLIYFEPKSGSYAIGLSDNKNIYLFFIHALMALLVLKYIGNNDGAFLSYYLQLFVPALIVISLWGIDL